MTPIDETIALVEVNKRVCPMPTKWNELWQLLPNKKQIGVGWNPPLPLILAAWWDTPNDRKKARLLEHIEYAEQHGSLEQVHQFLVALQEREWHHVGD